MFLNTMGDARPDHIGIVSDRLGSSGYPLIINNWTIGCTMLKKHELIKILRWLDPSAAPVLVQLPGVFFEK